MLILRRSQSRLLKIERWRTCRPADWKNAREYVQQDGLRHQVPNRERYLLLSWQPWTEPGQPERVHRNDKESWKSRSKTIFFQTSHPAKPQTKTSCLEYPFFCPFHQRKLKTKPHFWRYWASLHDFKQTIGEPLRSLKEDYSGWLQRDGLQWVSFQNEANSG